MLAHPPRVPGRYALVMRRENGCGEVSPQLFVRNPGLSPVPDFPAGRCVCGVPAQALCEP